MMLYVGGLLYLAMLLAFLFPLESFQQQAGAATMEVVSKLYSAGYLPVVGSYVEYEVRLTNSGANAIEGRPLQVSLFSDGMTHSAFNYSVSALGPGESKILHLGPFRIEHEGGHRLLAGMDGVSLEYEEDSFVAYRQEAVWAALVAIPLMAAGAVAVSFSLHRKRRAV